MTLPPFRLALATAALAAAGLGHAATAPKAAPRPAAAASTPGEPMLAYTVTAHDTLIGLRASRGW